MSFFKASKKAEDVKSSGSSYINKSGFFPVTILAAIVDVSKNGSTSIDFFVEHEGQQQMIYGNLRITNNDGSDNKIGAKAFNQLLVVADIDNVADPVEMALPIGKEGADKTVAVLEDLMDIEVLMRVQMGYSTWNGNIRESKNIRAFFRADKASAEEVVQDANFGAAYEKELKYADNVKYENDLTAESIQEWVSAGRPKGTAGTSAAATKAPSFGKKRFGNT